VDILNNYLPELGIQSCKVIRFEPDGDDPFAWSNVIGTSDKPIKNRFQTRKFPPSRLFPANRLLNLALLPIVYQDEAIGYVALEATDLKASMAITQQLAATFKVAQLHQQVVELSLTDSLTGLYNRRYMDHFIANEVERCRRYQRDLAFIMLDLDNFKEYNDRFGHPCGDEALRLISNCLLRHCRRTDIVMRYGGDEFAIVLPETDLHAAKEIAHRVGAAVATIPELEHPVTLSMGISMLQDSKYQVGALIKQADQALYEAKHKGRNQVSHFQPKQPTQR
jgi:diguanylate cyclase (GGDEF)-like protein